GILMDVHPVLPRIAEASQLQLPRPGPDGQPAESSQLEGQFRVRAVDLFRYGKTPAWPAETIQSLDDQARLVEAALPANADEVYLVGHSFGEPVAMKAAARLVGRVARLVLLEWAFTCALTKVTAQANSGPAGGGISVGPSLDP